MRLFEESITNSIDLLTSASNELELCTSLEHIFLSNSISEAIEISLIDPSGAAPTLIMSPSDFPSSKLITEYIVHAGKVQGIIRHIPTKSTPEHLLFISIILQISGICLSLINNSRSEHSIRRTLGMTTHLLDTFTEMLSRIMLQTNQESICNLAGQFLMGHFRTTTYVIVLKHAAGHNDIVSANGIDRSLLKDLLQIEYPMQSICRIGPFICSNMLLGNKSYGHILLGNGTTSGELTQEQTTFLSMLGMIISISLERSRLYDEKQKLMLLQRELDIANTVQKNLLPAFDQSLEGCDISGLQVSSLNIGGDYMDILRHADGSCTLIIADVSGKGIGAAMIMSMVKSACSLLSKYSASVIDIIRTINTLVFEHTAPETFVTCACISINKERSAIVSVNAGHEPPILVDSRGIKHIFHQGCMALGIVPNVPDLLFETIELNSGDILCMYTDGLHDSSFGNPHHVIDNVLKCVQEPSMSAMDLSLIHI